MFSVTTPKGKNLKFVFFHDNKAINPSYADPTTSRLIKPRDNWPNVRTKGLTKCMVFDDNGNPDRTQWTKIVESMALCSVKDNFSREKGRVISLQRVCDHLDVSELGYDDERELRQVVFNKYHERKENDKKRELSKL